MRISVEDLVRQLSRTARVDVDLLGAQARRHLDPAVRELVDRIQNTPS